MNKRLQNKWHPLFSWASAKSSSPSGGDLKCVDTHGNTEIDLRQSVGDIRGTYAFGYKWKLSLSPYDFPLDLSLLEFSSHKI